MGTSRQSNSWDPVVCFWSTNRTRSCGFLKRVGRIGNCILRLMSNPALPQRVKSRDMREISISAMEEAIVHWVLGASDAVGTVRAYHTIVRSYFEFVHFDFQNLHSTDAVTLLPIPLHNHVYTVQLILLVMINQLHTA
ncbi:hypothetical protein TNCV_4885981 [Trichonephila clavipes]|uniref:Uncharacterized protein n=1 Tax=Trichonephila clavipes TaxID=2585209 RepID=A0A8X6V5G0_TRICX|nr:hypothetical protein TNCV_4885981 [Trichonephila clavipes]